MLEQRMMSSHTKGFLTLMDPFRCSRKPGTALSHPEESFFDFDKPIAEVAMSLSSLGDKDVIP
jgi:hypothetical protein